MMTLLNFSCSINRGQLRKNILLGNIFLMPLANLLVINKISIYYAVFVLSLLFINKIKREILDDPIIVIGLLIVVLGLAESILFLPEFSTIFRSTMILYYLVYYIFCRVCFTEFFEECVSTYINAIILLSIILMFNYFNGVLIHGTRYDILNYNQNDLSYMFLVAINLLLFQSKKSILLRFPIFGLLSFSLLIMASRTIVAAAACSMILYVISALFTKDKAKSIFYIMLFLSGLIYLVIYVPQNLIDILKPTHISHAVHTGLDGRGYIWKNAIDDIYSHIFVGLGNGSFELIHGSGVHDFFLELTVDLGVAGTTLSILLVIFLFKNILESRCIWYSLAVFVGAVLYMMFQNAVCMYTFWFSLAQISIMVRDKNIFVIASERGTYA